MSDLISKAEVLSLVEHMMETYWDRKQILSIVRNGIEKLPSAEPKWIPVTERLNLISRKDAIKHIKAYRDEFKEDFGIDSEDGDDASHHFGYIAGLNRAARIIECLPSAEGVMPDGRQE